MHVTNCKNKYCSFIAISQFCVACFVSLCCDKFVQVLDFVLGFLIWLCVVVKPVVLWVSSTHNALKNKQHKRILHEKQNIYIAFQGWDNKPCLVDLRVLIYINVSFRNSYNLSQFYALVYCIMSVSGNTTNLMIRYLPKPQVVMLNSHPKLSKYINCVLLIIHLVAV